MIANYHTHTHYCGHASGEPEEYIRGALDMGLKTLGFSDHAPFRTRDGYEAAFRVPSAQAERCIAELRALREKYAGQLEMPIGFEMEYYPDYFDEMLAYVKSLGAEYLLLGQHFLSFDSPGSVRTMKVTFRDDDLRLYVDQVVAAMQTGKFTYVAHPDIIWYMGPKTKYLAEMRRLCQASLDTDTPLEINLLGLWGNRNYPCRKFWKLVGEMGCPVVLGIDAHGPNRFYQPEVLAKAEAMAARYGLKLRETVTLREI